MKLEFWVQDRFFTNQLAVYVVQRFPDGSKAVGQPLTMKTSSPDECMASEVTAPTFEVDRKACQSLMDQLYAQGIRPTDQAYSNEALGQAKQHIADLRVVTMKLLDYVVKPDA